MNVLNAIFMPKFNFALELSPIDSAFFIVFFSVFIIFIVLLLVKFIRDRKTSKIIKKEIAKQNGGLIGDNHLAKIRMQEQVETETVQTEGEKPAVEDKKEVVLEPATEEVVETKIEEEVQDEPVVEEVTEPQTEEVAETTEEPQEEPVVETTEETKEEKVEETKEETVEEPVKEEVTEEVVEPETEETTETVEVKHGREYKGKYEVYKDNEFYRYRLKASNGEVLLVSEIYNSYKTCLSSIDALKRNLEKGKALIVEDKRKNYKFKIVAANHRTIAIGANYATEARAQSALDSFKRFALTDDIVTVELPADELDSTLVLIEKVKDEDKRGGRFIIKKDNNGEFTWELKPNNGEILCQSGGYCTRSSIESSIQAFKEVVKTGKFYIYTDKNNNYQFKLYSKLGRLYMVGESYNTSQAVESVVKSILNFIDMAVIQDKSTATTAKKTTTKK